MKRPACARSQGKSLHKCSCCGSDKHRIEICPEKGAAKIRALLAQVRQLTEGRPKHVLRQERKTRKSAKVSGKHQERAQKEYRGENKPRQASPAARRRRLNGRRDFPMRSANEEEAAHWLIEHHWVPECPVKTKGGFYVQMGLHTYMRLLCFRCCSLVGHNSNKMATSAIVCVPRPVKCERCGTRHVSDLLWPADRPCGWRCLSQSCGRRMTFLAHSIFNGLRCGPIGLQALLLEYCKLDLATSPRVVDLVQNCGYGESCVRHFICAMRSLEAQAGFEACKSHRLWAKVEVDGNLLAFHISRNNTRYPEAIRRLERRLEKKGKSK